MRLKQDMAIGSVLLFCGGIAEASFFSDLVESMADSIAEQRDVAKAQERIIELWKKKNPGKPVSKGKLKRLEKYRKALEDSKEMP